MHLRQAREGQAHGFGGHRRHRHEGDAVVEDFVVDLVGHHHQTMARGEFGDLFEQRARIDRAGRICSD
jgi:hypothetical protein